MHRRGYQPLNEIFRSINSIPDNDEISKYLK